MNINKKSLVLYLAFLGTKGASALKLLWFNILVVKECISLTDMDASFISGIIYFQRRALA